MVSMTLYYFTLGINFSLGDIQSRWREQALMAGIKFVIIPLIAGAILYLLPLERDVKNILIIQSAMPAAIYSVIASILFNLDTKLASSIFVVNTIFFLVIVLPLLYLLRGIVL